MLTRQEFEQEVSRAKGANSHLFEKRIKWLKNQWRKSQDSTETREIAPIIVGPTPINAAIIADNLEYFKSHHEEDVEYSRQGLGLALKRACLCGSKQIGKFLLQKLNIKYTKEENGYILGYVSASRNTKWMKEIAADMVQAKAAMPSTVLRLASTKNLIMIEDIFNGRLPPESTLKEKDQPKLSNR